MINSKYIYFIFASLRLCVESSVLRQYLQNHTASLVAALFLLGCQPNSMLLEPEIFYEPSSVDVIGFPSAFPPLSQQEALQDWGKEQRIALMFAQEQDYYRAIGCWKRSLVLLPEKEMARRMQVEYNILLAYFLAGKKGEVVTEFEKSSLVFATAAFPAFGDMLVMLHEAYSSIGQEEKASLILSLIETGNSSIADKLNLGRQIRQGALDKLEERSCSDEETARFLSSYSGAAKSVRKAQLLNALLPGMGYAYVGQKKSALTSFLINTLFIAATWRLVERGHIAAACITGGLEFGWYAGGINGAGLAAKEYNQRLYEVLAGAHMRKKELFPLFMIETRF